jgi:hypothetical protein
LRLVNLWEIQTFTMEYRQQSRDLHHTRGGHGVVDFYVEYFCPVV